MTEAQSALADGIADIVSQHGVTVTVDGGATFSAVADGLFEGNMPTDYGMRQASGGQLYFARSAWTPVKGKRVTVSGIVFVVQSIDSTNSQAWGVTLAEGNQ